MFDFEAAPGPIRDEIRSVSSDIWHSFAAPGTWWSASDRVAAAEVARAARLDQPCPATTLTDDAVEVCRRVGAEPATITQVWVDDHVAALGEEAYTELLGIASMVVAVDTFTRLMGSTPEPFPAAQRGEPSRVALEEKPRKGKTWIAMAPMPVPPFVLSIVPEAMKFANRLEEAFYMSGPDMADDDYTRASGLHRTQIEFVAGSLSWGNECFY